MSSATYLIFPASKINLAFSSASAPLFFSALADLVYDPAARAKEPHFHSVRIQIQNLRNLFDRKAFDFFQNQHQAVALVKPFQEILDSLARFKSVADIRPAAAFFFGGDHLPGLLFAQVRLVNQGPHFFLSQQIPALVDGNLIQPSAESRPLVELLQREIRLNKNLLRNVLHILATPENTAGDGKDAVLMPAQELFKSLLVFALC